MEAANGYVQFVGARLTQERQGCAAVCAGGTNAPGPCDLMRCAVSQSKIVSSEGGPGHEGRATALATVGAMAVGDVIRLAGRFIADCAAQTTSENNACRHPPYLFK